MLFEPAQAIAQRRVHSAGFEMICILAKKNEDPFARICAKIARQLIRAQLQKRSITFIFDKWGIKS